MEPNLPLRDIHLPDPVGWWPLAPGWWIVFFGVPALLLSLAWLWRFLRRDTVKRMALRELEKIIQSDAERLEKVQRLEILLRRVSLSFYPREEVAGLVGKEWLAFLDRPLQGASKARRQIPFSKGIRWQEQSGDNTPSRTKQTLGGSGFSEGVGRLLIEAPYQREVRGDLEALFSLCREWIKRLPRPAGHLTRKLRSQAEK